MKCIARSIGNHATETRDEESPFFDCWDGKHEQFVVQQVDPWARIAPNFVPV